MHTGIDTERLADIAKDIEAGNLWHGFLSPQENKLLSAALNAGQETWAMFIEGNVPCQLSVTGSEESKEEPQVIEVDSATLAFRVRYMLWDRIMFNSPNGSQAISTSSVAVSQNGTSVEPKKDERGATDDFDDDDYEDTDNMKVEEKAAEAIVVSTTEDESEPHPQGSYQALLNYNRTYHTFDSDRDLILKFEQLEASDRKVEQGEGGEGVTSAAAAQFGAANLSLKHLLATLENRRDETYITDIELRNLISDVRKNRSKWASEDRAGQEELYEACEKVVLELRATTEHSTAFLNKVNKRDAPNYYQIIKNPMDLSTVMRKLRALQYRSKQEFVDDLMLIWQNCLTYNSDPKHFLRAHAIAMRKKTQALTPLIPDITIRSREEVEAEAKAEAGAAAAATASPGGLNRQKSSKGQKRKLQSAVPQPDELERPDSTESSQVDDKASSTGSDNDMKKGTETTDVERVEEEKSAEPNNEDKKSIDTAPATSRTTTAGEEDESDEETVTGISTEEQEPFQSPDIETTIWQSTTKRRRLTYLSTRKDLFTRAGLAPEAPIPLRRPGAMSKFLSATNSLTGTISNNHRPKTPSQTLTALDEEDPFLVEYEVMSGVPSLPPSDPIGDLPAVPAGGETSLPPSKYSQTGVVNTAVDRNLNEMQDIRRLCAKILLIREMQQNPGYPIGATSSLVNTEFPPIVNPEPPLSSRFPASQTMYGPAAAAEMRRVSAKISMHTGFEVTQRAAIDILAEIGGEYLFKLGEKLVSNLEDIQSTASFSHVLSGSLKDMGVPKLDSLMKHLSDDIFKLGRRLTEFKHRLSGNLAELLRPEIERYKDEQFQDNSDQFVLGQFSNELGDDYFGFKDLGLDKELGVANIAIPFHLLQQRLATGVTSDSGPAQSFRRKGLTVPNYPPVGHDALPRIIGLLRPAYARFIPQEAEVPASATDPILSARTKVPASGKLAPRKRHIEKAFIRHVPVIEELPLSPPSLQTTDKVDGEENMQKTGDLLPSNDSILIDSHPLGLNSVDSISGLDVDMSLGSGNSADGVMKSVDFAMDMNPEASLDASQSHIGSLVLQTIDPDDDLKQDRDEIQGEDIDSALDEFTSFDGM